MDIKLSERKIIERCGTAAFNRGESYFKGNKVTIHQDTKEHCEATVSGIDEFHVEIYKKDKILETSCTCPKLASITIDCQHIAAVLHALLHRQNRTISNDLMRLFTEDNVRSIASQRHFEARLELKTVFICRVIKQDNENLLAIEINIENKKIDSIINFLRALKEGEPYQVTETFIYDIHLHSFSLDTDAVLKQLLDIALDKQLIKHMTPDETKSMIIIPPSTWKTLFPLLKERNIAALDFNEGKFVAIREEKSVLPLKFAVDSRDGKATLRMTGMDQLTLLPSYQFALYGGLFYRLTEDATRRLAELQKLLQDYNSIGIPEEQLLFFSEKVIPKLKGIGDVSIAKEMMRHFNHPPLTAKLYLDRVNNRLLAGLEFHYDYLVIHPLKDEERQSKSVTIRDVEKEDIILAFMDRAEFHKTEGGYFLYNEQLEYEFLENTLPLMEKYVDVYATTAVRNRILPQPVKPKIKIKHQKDRVDWLEFKFEIEGFPEKEIKEILAALSDKKKYYRLRSGSLLSLESNEFAEVQKFLMQAPLELDELKSSFEMPLVKGLKLIDSFAADDVLTAEDSFQQFLQTITDPEVESIQVPTQVNATLRDYQKQGFHWMKTLSAYGFGGVLADDMGLGKTLQSITYIVSVLQEMRENDQQILIICPSSVMYHWRKEMKRFAPDLQVEIIIGNKEKRLNLLAQFKKLDVMISSYTSLKNDIDWYKERNFHTIFFDEAQAFKNPRTQTARAMKKLKATNRFALTGTPMENNADELWAIFHVVFPELFGSLEEYNHLSRKKISRRIRPFMLRRMKKDVAIELPEKIENLEIVELYPEQKKLYAAYLAKLRHETLKHLDQDTIRKNRIKILAGLTRLRQICCHPALFTEDYTGRSAKLTRLMSIIKESQYTNRRMLIFSQFTSMLQLIARNLSEQGTSFFYLDGSTPPEEREARSERFNNGERDIFLISLKAGGTGLNLTGADTVILYDLWWNPAVEEQAADRAYRIGQKNTVQVIKLLAKGTIEEKMNQLQERKRNLIKEIIDPDEETSAVLTLDDIQELLD